MSDLVQRTFMVSDDGRYLRDENGVYIIVSEASIPQIIPKPDPTKQPILGSVEWMFQSMRTVHPVFDGNNLTQPIYLQNDSGQFLKDDNGNFLTGGTVTIPANLVRWI